MRTKNKIEGENWLLIMVLILSMVIVILGCRIGEATRSSRVTYVVTSSEDEARIAYTMANGETSEMTVKDTPWRKTVIFRDIVVYLLVGNPYRYGEISCEIFLNGQSLSLETAVYPEDKIACRLFVP